MEIRFDIGAESGHPHLPVLVNGQGPFIFTLDTGATATTISKSLAEKLGIRTYEGDKKMASGVGGGRVPVAFAKVDRLQIGTEVVENEEVLVIDFESAMGGVCFTAGVIGHSFLKNYVMSVNYPEKRIRLERTKGASSRRYKNVAWQEFQYVEDSHLISVPTYINGNGPFHLVVDTGSGGTVITPRIAQQLGFTEDQAVAAVRVANPTNRGCADGCQGVGGKAQAYGVQIDSVSVGPVTQENTIAAVIDLKVVSPRGELIRDGIIGYPFMKDLEVIIDYPNRRFAFLRTETASQSHIR
ncbi:MAG: hypothetical protein C4K49_02770 [Candidatus Thorarchaeota archaeon]|nr:MAG: hypothetical protein C4K49_02770 [Candidatus Thorarchaeota archaeon]